MEHLDPGGVDDGVDDADLVALLDDARTSAAAEARVRRRWLRRQAEESATLVGALVDLAERRGTVVLATVDGTRWRGRVEAVGEDVVVLHTAGAGGAADLLAGAEGPGDRVLVALAGVAWVRPRAADGSAGGAGRELPGDRAAPPATTLLDLLAAAAADGRVAVALHVGGGGEALRGRLVAVGADVVVVRPEGGDPTPAYVAGASVLAAVLRASG